MITIEDSAFRFGESMKDVDIPASVTSIGKSAFYWCTSLEAVRIPKNSNMITIEDRAFEGCKSLELFSIPKSLNYIGRTTFKDCPLLKDGDVLMEDIRRTQGFLQSELDDDEL